MSPVSIDVLLFAILSEIAFIREVLPAPEAPIIYRVVPGKAYPEQFFKTSIFRYFSAPSLCSSFVDLTIT